MRTVERLLRNALSPLSAITPSLAAGSNIARFSRAMTASGELLMSGLICEVVEEKKIKGEHEGKVRL